MSTSTLTGPRTISARPTAPKPATSPSPLAPSLRQLGFWSATAMATTYIVFFLSSSFALGVFLRVPWDQIIPIGASILIAPSFVLLIVSLHYTAPVAKRMWSHAAIAFAILYAAFVSIVYITLLFVVEPHVVHHTESEVAPFLFGHGTFLQMLDGLGYTYMSLAVFLTAPLFAGGRLNNWIRRIAIASGPGALGVLVSYVVYTGPLTLLGIGAFLVPVYAILLAIYFRRAQLRAEVR
jgi:hypothetical protein